MSLKRRLASVLPSMVSAFAHGRPHAIAHCNVGGNMLSPVIYLFLFFNIFKGKTV